MKLAVAIVSSQNFESRSVGGVILRNSDSSSLGLVSKGLDVIIENNKIQNFSLLD